MNIKYYYTIYVMFLTASVNTSNMKPLEKKVFPKLGERHFVSIQIEKEDLVKRVNGILSLN